MNTLLAWFDATHQALFEGLVQPLLYGLGQAHLLEDAFTGTAWFLVGCMQLLITAVVFGALERWRPVEAVQDPAAVRDDIVYTVVHRLGVFRVGLFLLVDPLVEGVVSQARMVGWHPWQLEQIIPWLGSSPWAVFVAYLLLFDLVDYWIHRGQHGVNRWWQLHALHHSQRQMTRWSDNRNHLVDDLARDVILVAVAQVIGIAPAQFIAVVAVTQLIESLSHANTRLSFGPVLSRLLVGPAFHRYHHTIGVGHESRGAGTLGGHNFAVLFPVWDILFGTARWDTQAEPTGVRDQLPAHGGRDYGRGFWRQQWLGLRRLVNPVA
jgi:sterol desaturase/sphingolipid hydroxylase (fatty acid hydroxylase superfamily)